MPRYEALNNVTHAGLRVDTRFGPEFGDALGMVPAYPTEFAELQREYPIFLRRGPAGDGFEAVALLGFEQHENLFLRGGVWSAAYLPGALARGPFLIGFQERTQEGERLREPVIHVDMEHPRVSATVGQAVFLPQGGYSPYLEQVITVLRGIHEGAAAARTMFAALDAHQLIQPLQVDVRLDSEVGIKLSGLHGIDRERLQALDPAALHALNHAGWLEGAYLILASQHNLRRLIGERQRRMREAAATSGSSGRAA